MPLDSSMLALVPFASGLLTTTVAILLLRRQASATGPACMLLFTALSIWLFAESLALSMHDLGDRILVGKLIYPGVVAVPVAVLLLAARAARRDAWITRRTLLALWVIPVCTLVFVATNGSHGLMWPSIERVSTPAGVDLDWKHGPAFWASAGYAYALLGWASWLMLGKYRRDWRRYRTEAVLVLTGLLAPWIANAVYLSGNSPLGNLDLTPYGFTVTAVLLAFGLAREGILEAAPVSRSTVVQQLGDGLLVLDRRDRVVDLNASSREILGLEGRPVHELHASDALAGTPALLALLDAGADAVSRAIEIRTPAGARSFDVQVSELREEGRHRVGRLVVLRDVTDYLHASNAARAAAVAKSQFLANMSHEIRTPMNGVLGLAQHLAGLDLDAEPRAVVADILKSGRALVEIIDDILDFSKLEAGKLRLDPTPFSPRELLGEVGRLLGPRAREKGIVLATDVDPGVPGWMLGDGGRIRQVLLNLASNAVKFTKQGSVVLRARAERDAEGSPRLRLEVEDTGIGIPPDVQESIFGAFTQADASTTRRFGGTGLGLAISRELVACMGGELGLRSVPGEGSTFWCVLPLPVCAAPAPEASMEAVAPRPVGSGPRVLAVEDNAVNQRVVQRLLERLGCRVDLASDGREAVERARSGAYDLVLMDCQMPVLDGFGATREIRALGGTAASVPIVALTAHALPGDRERCLGHGMDDYLTKPLRLEDLGRVLGRFTGASSGADARSAPSTGARARVDAAAR